MKILHISHSMAIGGAERSLFQLIRGQLNAGLEPSLAVLSRSGLYGNRVADLGVPVIELKQRNAVDLRIAKKGAQVAKQFDCVHFQTQTPMLMRAIGRQALVPTAYTHRSGELRVTGKRRAMHYISGKLISRYIDAVSGNTLHAANCAKSTYHLSRKQLRVTYNGIDFGLLQPKRTKDDVLRELGEDQSQTKWRIGTSANLRALKRIDLLIKAVARLGDDSVFCYVIGDGPARSSLQSLAASLGIPNQVKFLGMKEHIGDYLQILDGFALLSDQAESFGNSAVEAMGLGIPTVVMADGGGMIEHFPTSEAPLPKNLNELTRHLHGWIHDRQRTERFAKECKAYVTQKYTLENTVNSYGLLYQSAAAAFHHRRSES